MKIDMEFARRDDCLDKMVPSDLRLILGKLDHIKKSLSGKLTQLDRMLEDEPDNTYWAGQRSVVVQMISEMEDS
jgi:hypothetical protein